MKRLKVIDIDAPDPDWERETDLLDGPPFNTDGIENAYFARLRPRDCDTGPRPCPWLNCRFHNGEQSPRTCAIDVADSGDGRVDGVLPYREIGRLLGISGKSAFYVERRAMKKLLALRRVTTA